jgi:hypothetical protein
VLNELVDHDRLLDLAASHVRTMTEVVQQMRQQAAGRIMAGSYLNMYDVNTALEVLTTGRARWEAQAREAVGWDAPSGAGWMGRSTHGLG